MTSQKETWEDLKAKYLREVEKALSSVQHPRSRDVLADVKSHLEQRFAELKPDQKNWEDFQGIIADMGPPADYAELLGPQAERPVTRAQRKYLVAAGSVVVILVAVIWLLVSITDSAETYIVAFRPLAPFAPQTARELLHAFNERHPRGVRTHHYRTKVQDNALVGYICVDTEAGKAAVISMLEKSRKLTFANVARATPEAFEKHRAMGQPSLKTGSTQAAAQMKKLHRPAAREREVLRQLRDSLEQWLKDHREPDAAKCDSLIEQILNRPRVSPEAYFTAASAVRLRGRPQKAADILRKALAICPKEKAPGLNLPVDFVAHFRIGAMARHSGNAEEATKAYENAIKNTEGIEAAEFHKAICYMYLAEIAREILKDDQLAMKRLKEVTSIIDSVNVEKVSPDWAGVWPVLKGWTSYEYARLRDVKAAVSDSSKYPEAADEGVLGLAMIRMSLGGLEHPVLLQQAAQSDKSPIDSALAKLALAFNYMHSGKNLEARKYLSELAESDSYFAPYGNELLNMHLDLPGGR
ncbi:MAG: tetratricopeptide repeat protein [Planctomycetota bacterium]|jgi:tetratricopeptide (TPR) repeat protein